MKKDLRAPRWHAPVFHVPRFWLFPGIKFRRAPESLKGISSLCILAQGTTDNTLDKTVGTFWDNISIEYSPAGMMLIMR